jgi:hypothetical protein
MRLPLAVTLSELPARQNTLIETPSLGAAQFNTSPSARDILSSPCSSRLRARKDFFLLDGS